MVKLVSQCTMRQRKKRGTTVPTTSQSRRILRACDKHGGHGQVRFYPISHLTMENLPESVRTKSTLRFVQRLARLVVRVRVGLNRQNLDQQKDCEDLEGDLVPGVTKHVGGGCTCTGVVTSLSEGKVTVAVPLHAVRSDAEAQHATADFFYDGDSNPITTSGSTVTRPDNLCHLTQLTCPSTADLGQRLQFVKDTISTTSAISFAAKLADPDCVRCLEDSVVVVVSHPHGFPQSVSFGRLCRWVVVKESGEIEDAGDLNRPQDVAGQCVSGARRPLHSSPEVKVEESSLDCVSSALTFSTCSSTLASLRSRSTVPGLSSSVAHIQDIKLIEKDSELPEVSGIAVEPSFVCLSVKSKSIFEYNSNNENITDSKKTIISVENENSSAVDKTVFRTEGGLIRTGEATPSWTSWIISIMLASHKILGTLGRYLYGIPGSVSRKVVQLYHDAATCAGSSGGALVVIGPGGRAWLDGTGTSSVVFSHVGVKGAEGLAVPVVLNGTVLCLAL